MPRRRSTRETTSRSSGLLVEESRLPTPDASLLSFALEGGVGQWANASGRWNEEVGNRVEHAVRPSCNRRPDVLLAPDRGHGEVPVACGDGGRAPGVRRGHGDGGGTA